ncbi:tRNA (adenosine(37)-N6)-threonylcarbamoyltransferase complex transferase subunit TsaD [bacterium]|nr:tRNA (adenosine(37)-N6)-threonylcarbamoyltransferase complex transferase subunit TsaD [bacterium]
MIILGIETSCDETAISLIEAERDKLKTLSNIISSQVKLHARWGGVVPNLAAREHLKNIIPVLKTAFKKAGVKPSNIDLIATTQGPGLIPALLIGANAAKTLSYVWKKPLIGIHHIEGHIYANFIRVDPKFKIQNSKFPILCLVVSGGHTQLVLMKKHLDYKIIGQTLDDAVGEAFDKTARILGLGYPGGPAIAAYAAKWKSKNSKNKTIHNTLYKIHDTKLPRPMINSKDFNFSFSGLKTAVLYKVKKLKKLPVTDYELLVTGIAAEFQQAAIDVLISKTIKAAEKYNPKTIMLAGGVSANQELRKQLSEFIEKNLPSARYILPAISYSTDNAAMVAAAGYFRWREMPAARRKKALRNWQTLQADANLELA